MATTAPTSPTTDNSERNDVTSKTTIVQDVLCKEQKRKRARFLYILTCLAYLAVAIQLLHSGISNTRHVMKPHIQEAKTMLRTQANEMYRQKTLAERLITLQTKQLGKVSFESHEACLARGIKAANQHLLRIGFRYPEIREQAIVWTEENCARLLFVPQTKSRPTRQQIILDYLTEIGHRCREYSIYAVAAMKQMVNYVWKGMPSVYDRQDRPTAPKPTDNISCYSCEFNFGPSTGRKLPASITIVCKNSTVCHINDERTPNMPSKPATTSREEVVESARRVEMLREIMNDLTSLENTITKLMIIIFLMTCFILGAYIGQASQFRNRTKPLFKHAWSIRGLILDELDCIIWLNLMGALVDAIGELIQFEGCFSSNLNLAFVFFFLTTGITMLVVDLLNPWSSRPNIYKSIGEMYQAIYDKNDVPSHQETSDEVASEETPTGPVTPPSTAPSDDSEAYVDPAVEISDIETEFDTESDVYTESGPDSDEDDFIDLGA